MIEFEFLGAAQGVTGSKHVVHTARASILIDCGLFQGRRAETFEKNRKVSIDPNKLDAVVLSHAHIDHSGALPLLCKQGYGGPIYATLATRDLSAPMLHDTAAIQESDARHIARLLARGVPHLRPVEPLYQREDVTRALGQMIGLPYHHKQQIAPGVSVTFLEAGHVLGSAIVVLDIEDEGQIRRVAFTGDLGRHHLPILRDPEVPTGVECLITESTYGDRMHPPIERMGQDLADVVRRTIACGGKVIIPSFALERAQEVVYELKRLLRAGQIPSVPVYVDSPLTVKLTEIFKLHPECYDQATLNLLESADPPFQFPGLRYISDVEESKQISIDEAPCIIISASGMCEGGRILHHLRTTIGNARNTIVMVGFQAQHTLGRRLVEKRREVRIFGMMHDRRADVVMLAGFSAHADQKGLLDFAEGVRRFGPLRKVILVHGEPPAQEALAAALTERGFPDVVAPALGQRIQI